MKNILAACAVESSQPPWVEVLSSPSAYEAEGQVAAVTLGEGSPAPCLLSGPPASLSGELEGTFS